MIRRAVLVAYPAVFLGGAIATAVHIREGRATPVDLVLPVLVSLVFLALFISVLRRPEALQATLWAAFLTAMTALILVAWLSTIKAARSDEIKLVNILPPVSALLLPTLMSTVLFMRPRWVVVAMIIGWVLAAPPVLWYLAMHPAELWTLRGLEIAIMLGPTTLIALGLIPFFKGLRSADGAARDGNPAKPSVVERDPLTNACTRPTGERFLKRFVEAADPNSGLIMFDLDFFKGVNDNHGRRTGDEVLRAVTERCASRLRRDDVLIRWDGEVFLILIHGAPRKVVNLVAEDLKNSIADEPIEPSVRVTASFGVTQLKLMDSTDSVVQRLEEALQAAKKSGRNQVAER